LDLDMEADLGIDTVKQAELFALFGEKYNLLLNQGLQLKDYPTIRHCINYVYKELSSGNIAEAKEEKAEVKPVVEEPTPQSEVKVEEVAKPANQTKQISEEELTKEIVNIVSEKTGYPQDMLELDLDMEADLGIDTVKQAELFALFGEKYNLPLNQGLQLKDYPTIRHCINYVYKELSGQNTTKTEAKTESKADTSKEETLFKGPAKTELSKETESEIKNQEDTEPKPDTGATSYEEQKLRFVPLSAPAPLTPLKARKLSAQRVVLIMSDNAPITKAYSEVFKEQGIKTHTFTTLRARTKNTTIVNWDSLEETISAFEEFAKNNPLAVQGIIYALPCSIKKFDKRVNPNTELTKNLMPLFNACKIFFNDLKKRDDADTFVAVISKLDGNFGYQTKEPVNPIIGAVYGGATCFRKDLYETAGVLTKIIDFREETQPEQMAQPTLSEILTGDERGQVSFDGLERKTILCLPRKINKEVKLMDLEGKTIAFTGAARGIGAILAQKIAKEYQSRILILDIIELLDKTPYYATLSEQDLAALKQELWQKLKADTSIKATPVLLEKEFGKIKDSITLYKTIQKLKALGSEVEYYHCDVTNSSMLKDVVMKIKKKYGRLDGLIHFAGLEHSKLLTDKTIEEYYKVFGVKATSAAAFLALNLVKETGFYAFASSIAGKFGNLGQSDYASASDYLAKLALSLTRQGQRAVSIAMSAYSKVGMGVRPGVFDFLTKQGLKFVDPEVGMQIFLDEIVYGKVPEIVLTDDLGQLDTDKQICFDEPNLLEEEAEEDDDTKDNNSNNTPSS
ncbi:MAG: SDR family NAD(P)-dependent oxidoreductase, partial [Campylobacter sp.]|nr:SDR family NAD(P)-dependent oxidoreductase [Campylobacter sp.]